MAEWYDKPYLKGEARGPAQVPRILYAPSENHGTYTGDDAMAFKRAISHAGRFDPWRPAEWDYTYGEIFAKGRGTGQVGGSGVRGFQRQEWPKDQSKQTGILNEETYQKIRRALISDPAAPNYKDPILDARAVELLYRQLDAMKPPDKVPAWRQHITDFCNRAESAASELWVYSQARPFSGLGVAPEKAHRNDCSGYCVIAYFWARREAELNVPDPSGYNYSGYGNTWDDLDGHPRVSSGQYLVGDLAHYNGHVTICKRSGDSNTSRWSSFGSEPRPETKTLYYRGDFEKVVRPPLGSA